MLLTLLQQLSLLSPMYVDAILIALKPLKSNLLSPATIQAMTTLPVSLEVTFAAYLAVIVGTLVPVTFLITLYSQVSYSIDFPFSM